MVTFCLMCLFIYMYGIVLTQYFPEYIQSEFGGIQSCNTLFQCFINSFNNGIRPSGGLADAMIPATDLHSQSYFPRLIFNISYLLLIKMIILNIIAGIIIETFGELRNEAQLREDDLSNYCLICGSNRWEIEKKQVKFVTLIRKKKQIRTKYVFLISIVL